MALRAPTRSRAHMIYDLMGGSDCRPIAWTSQVRRRIERLPNAGGLALVVGVGVGLYVAAIGGISIALSGNGSILYVMLGVPIVGMSAVIAAHLTPPRILELRE
jgi:hypothetical protein